VKDTQLLNVAKRASVVIALFSFIVAPLLQFAGDGLWQVIRVFTGFYNIPIIAIVIVGLFTRHVPAVGPKLVIAFHVLAYALLQFVFKDTINIHFLHLYAILFVFEIGIMLFVGHRFPLTESWTYSSVAKIDMQPWVYAIPCAITLMSSVVALYLLFSTVGLVDGLSDLFWPLIFALFSCNILIWWRFIVRRMEGVSANKVD
jgi:SSS family solute:Na+ symporter